MQQQRRINEYRAQQQYLAQLRQQQLRLQTARNYSNDPYIRTAPSYRYAYSGTTRETNQYGADLLRQAVNYGYQEGVRFGQADRQDGLPANYRNSFAYQDANYGYSGYYVDQADYNYYFRQGFQRGYADGYNSQSQYGTSFNGTPSILATLLSSILGLTSLR
jgi:flagellar biosynthesis/type III secretory pathway protein FliH